MESKLKILMEPKRKIQNPSFREEDGTIILDDFGLMFNASPIGPMDFESLRNADYGEGFRMPTIRELIPLIYTSLTNPQYESAQRVTSVMEKGLLTGNTGVVYSHSGILVNDNPNMKGVRMRTEGLKDSLSIWRRGLVSSEDGEIRYFPLIKINRNDLKERNKRDKELYRVIAGDENINMIQNFLLANRLGDVEFERRKGEHREITSIVGLELGWTRPTIDMCKTAAYKDRYSFGVKNKGDQE